MRCDENSYTESCFHCQRPSTAVWHGIDAVHVCEACALEVLPALIADAVHASAPGTGDYQQHLKAIEAAFWKAVAARLAHENRPVRPRPATAVTVDPLAPAPF